MFAGAFWSCFKPRRERLLLSILTKGFYEDRLLLASFQNAVTKNSSNTRAGIAIMFPNVVLRLGVGVPATCGRVYQRRAPKCLIDITALFQVLHNGNALYNCLWNLQ